MLDKIKEFLALIQHYAFVAMTFSLAILAFLFIRRGEKIKDLQHEIVLNKLDNQLNDAASKAQIDQNAYDESISKYRKLKKSYEKLYGN